ncbi:hypothetical protein KNT81_gp253 [Proteus phage phiP4-3]|uniref:Uncharacterized protein n=1 Tax=Proteus phage phiP4-3 TaxID=2065203 RepID=A0A2I6PFL3_9CAUD|nr:hypothetical protein KNT81_gp253 [Proteus phage phiP4-3]AUM58518.1 hypothetical protein phiP43_160 [Proteus phage phiP4-3]
MYIAFHITSESSDHYLFCEDVEFTEHGMDVLFDTLKNNSDIPSDINYRESLSLSNEEAKMLRGLMSRLYDADY